MEIDNRQALESHAYAITMAINTLVTAMGMQAENALRLAKNEAIAYPEEAFQKIINDNGTHHNAVLSLSFF